MDISLIHNPEAGGAVAVDEILDELRRGGFHVVCDITTDSDFQTALEEKVAFVAVAGGDGTVRQAVRALAGRGVPLAVLPTGTANNIASSLGTRGTVREIVSRWRLARRRPFDLGLVRGDSGDAISLESVGGGLVPAGTRRAQTSAVGEEETAKDAIAASLEAYRDALASLAPQRWTLGLDGESIESELLLAEILNIPSVGPQIAFAADADPADGLFDVVTAGEAERAQLAAYLDGRLAGKGPRLALPLRRAQRVEVRGWRRMHVDDEIRDVAADSRVTIEVLPGGIEFLV